MTLSSGGDFLGSPSFYLWWITALGYSVEVRPTSNGSDRVVTVTDKNGVLVAQSDATSMFSALESTALAVGAGADEINQAKYFARSTIMHSGDVPEHNCEVVAHWKEFGTDTAYYKDGNWYYISMNHSQEMPAPDLWCYLPDLTVAL